MLVIVATNFVSLKKVANTGRRYFLPASILRPSKSLASLLLDNACFKLSRKVFKEKLRQMANQLYKLTVVGVGTLFISIINNLPLCLLNRSFTLQNTIWLIIYLFYYSSILPSCVYNGLLFRHNVSLLFYVGWIGLTIIRTTQYPVTPCNN